MPSAKGSVTLKSYLDKLIKEGHISREDRDRLLALQD